MLALCVFDCDGTLVDSQYRIASAMAQAMADNGLPAPSREQVRRVIGLKLLTAIAVLAPQIDHDQRRHIAASYNDAFAELRRRGEVAEPLFPGTRESLTTLDRQGWLLGVATGKSLRGTLLTLAAHDLTELFITLQTADIAAGKPAPDMMLRAMSETGVPPERTVMVGDTVFDIEMAKNAGVRSVGVAWGYHHTTELRGAGADVIVESFAALTMVVNALIDDG